MLFGIQVKPGSSYTHGSISFLPFLRHHHKCLQNFMIPLTNFLFLGNKHQFKIRWNNFLTQLHSHPQPQSNQKRVVSVCNPCFVSNRCQCSECCIYSDEKVFRFKCSKCCIHGDPQVFRCICSKWCILRDPQVFRFIYSKYSFNRIVVSREYFGFQFLNKVESQAHQWKKKRNWVQFPICVVYSFKGVLLLVIVSKVAWF